MVEDQINTDAGLFDVALTLSQQNVAGSVLVSLSSTSQTTPNYWVNPLNRVNYVLAVQTPPDRMDSVDAMMNTPILNYLAAPASSSERAGQAPDPPPPQLLSNLASLSRTVSESVVSHYNVQPVFEVYANVQGRDLGAVSADVNRVVDAMRPNLPRGSSIAIFRTIGYSPRRTTPWLPGRNNDE